MDRAWELLGLRLESLTDAEKQEVTSRTYPGARGPVRYNGGLRIIGSEKRQRGREVRQGRRRICWGWTDLRHWARSI
jgi:hypothetical protein